MRVSVLLWPPWWQYVDTAPRGASGCRADTTGQRNQRATAAPHHYSAQQGAAAQVRGGCDTARRLSLLAGLMPSVRRKEFTPCFRDWGSSDHQRGAAAWMLGVCAIRLLGLARLLGLPAWPAWMDGKSMVGGWEPPASLSVCLSV